MREETRQSLGFLVVTLMFWLCWVMAAEVMR